MFFLTSTHQGSAEGNALCREREGVPRFLLLLAGRRPANRVMSELAGNPIDSAGVDAYNLCIIIVYFAPL